MGEPYAAEILGSDSNNAHGIEYLLTWNCTHIVNAVTRPKIETMC
jgi:hypothetical protein